MVKRICIVPAFGPQSPFFDPYLSNFGKKTLIQHTVEQASSKFDKVVFSTDSEKYLSKIQDLEIENVVCSIRKYGFSTEERTLDESAFHYFKQYRKHFSQIWMVLPTCPLRHIEDIEDAQEMLNNEVDGVVGVTRMDYCPYFCLQIENNFLCDWHETQPRKNRKPIDRVYYRKVYRPNGALYGKWMKSFEEKPSWLSGNITAHIMGQDRSLNIRNKNDLELANIIYKNLRREK